MDYFTLTGNFICRPTPLPIDPNALSLRTTLRRQREGVVRDLQPNGEKLFFYVEFYESILRPLQESTSRIVGQALLNQEGKPSLTE